MGLMLLSGSIVLKWLEDAVCMSMWVYGLGADTTDSNTPLALESNES